jgi:hypothetical protein
MELTSPIVRFPDVALAALQPQRGDLFVAWHACVQIVFCFSAARTRGWGPAAYARRAAEKQKTTNIEIRGAYYKQVTSTRFLSGWFFRLIRARRKEAS